MPSDCPDQEKNESRVPEQLLGWTRAIGGRIRSSLGSTRGGVTRHGLCPPAAESGVAVSRAVLGVPVNLDDVGVNIDHHPLTDP